MSEIGREAVQQEGALLVTPTAYTDRAASTVVLDSLPSDLSINYISHLDEHNHGHLRSLISFTFHRKYSFRLLWSYGGERVTNVRNVVSRGSSLTYVITRVVTA